jgi:hypothetical protein
MAGRARLSGTALIAVVAVVSGAVDGELPSVARHPPLHPKRKRKKIDERTDAEENADG